MKFGLFEIWKCELCSKASDQHGCPTESMHKLCSSQKKHFPAWDQQTECEPKWQVLDYPFLVPVMKSIFPVQIP